MSMLGTEEPESMSTMFGYEASLLDRFPGVVGGVIYASGLGNGPTPAGLGDRYVDEQRRVAERLANQPIAEIPSITAWRRTFTAFGVKPTQHRVAAEALLRRLHKQGDIPTINTLVDLGNLVSIRHGLPVAVFDQGAVTGPTTVRFADGDERFTDLGADDPVCPEPGEVIFVDEAGLVSARRWCWRQSAQSATKPTTTEALITVEGLHDSALDDVGAAVNDLLALLDEYQPDAKVESSLLSPASGGAVRFDH
ncbi:MAG: hypothetical protein GY724_10770 [Actinomycetia bacterium]|nr:hypothetical protein [Actinomycetes bacterium]